VGVTVVIATHDVHLIDQFAAGGGARRIGLSDGRVTAPAGIAVSAEIAASDVNA
jgi:ABC-type ATPase involved in cell division